MAVDNSAKGCYTGYIIGTMKESKINMTQDVCTLLMIFMNDDSHISYPGAIGNLEDGVGLSMIKSL